ncbi:hypothetical protein LSUE1_G010139, partial [Lachnellula suecica]
MPTMMEIQHVELTIEDVLSLHRHWISKLYVEDLKSEVEIVQLLYERRLPVAISQIQRCLRDWDLRPDTPSSRSSTDTSTSTSMSTASEEWELIRAPSPASSTSSVEPQNVELYTKRPLPSLPQKSTLPRGKRNMLKVTCHNRPVTPYEVEMTLGVLTAPKGPSPLQAYALDQQSHERVAVGLGRVPIFRTYEVREAGGGKGEGRQERDREGQCSEDEGDE